MNIFQSLARPLTPRMGDMAVLWTCAIVGVCAILLDFGAFGA